MRKSTLIVALWWLSACSSGSSPADATQANQRYTGSWVVVGEESEQLYLSPDSGLLVRGDRLGFVDWRELDDGSLFLQVKGRDNSTVDSWLAEVLNLTRDRLTLLTDGDTIHLVREEVKTSSPASFLVAGLFGPRGMLDFIEALEVARTRDDSLEILYEFTGIAAEFSDIPVPTTVPDSARE